jgi:deoxyribodipyrimidine photo-lyase
MTEHAQSHHFEPTREAGLKRLEAFIPSAGRHYEAKRNADLGPGQRGNVSMLSPYIRHRLISEEEVLAAVLAHHESTTAEKFIQEVVWRTYFKGHLETRPEIWARYRLALAGQVDGLAEKGGVRKAYGQAIDGRTGIDCFDAWVNELLETGYLHNHARMWFASIWIFTLRLPWELGADFMLRHLLDGDPASNTLSWRWVGGLHTKGKTYLARRDNIIANTGGRFSPKGLAPEALPLDEPSLPSARPARSALAAWPAGRIGLLLTEEDLNPDCYAGAESGIVAVAAASAVADRSPLETAAMVQAFTTAALRDGMARAARTFSAPATELPSLSAVTLADWARQHDLTVIATPYAPVGPVATAIADAAEKLTAQGIQLVEVRRAYDTLAWPHASRGFFAMKERIPDLLRACGISGASPDTQYPLFQS